MSEPLTSHEIEDVLSSIRRLVSEDLRPGRGAGTAAPGTPAAQAEGAQGGAEQAGAEQAGAEAGKLLLTPALRVVPDAPAEPDEDDAALSRPDLAAPAAVQPDADSPPVPPADEVYDDAGLDEGDNGLKALLDSAGPSPATAAASEPVDEVIWASAGEDAEFDDELIEPPPAAPAAARGETHGHWTAQDVPGMDWSQEETDWVEPEPMPFVAHPRKAGLANDPLARAWADRAEAAVRDELAGLTARGVTPPPEAPTAQAEIDDDDDTQAEAPHQTRSAHAADPGPGLFDGEDPVLDEEALRDIVRDIIREELAGTLGERITRNVRKLVRVEINRALTAREFE